jgi:hypothetical protein
LCITETGQVHGSILSDITIGMLKCSYEFVKVVWQGHM